MPLPLLIALLLIAPALVFDAHLLRLSGFSIDRCLWIALGLGVVVAVFTGWKPGRWRRPPRAPAMSEHALIAAALALDALITEQTMAEADFQELEVYRAGRWCPPSIGSLRTGTVFRDATRPEAPWLITGIRGVGLSVMADIVPGGAAIHATLRRSEE